MEQVGARCCAGLQRSPRRPWGLNHGQVLSHSSGDDKPKISVWARREKDFFLGLFPLVGRRPSFPYLCLTSASPLCMSVCLEFPFWAFPGNPVVKTPHFQSRRCGFDPLEETRSHIPVRCGQKGEKKKREGVPLLGRCLCTFCQLGASHCLWEGIK